VILPEKKKWYTRLDYLLKTNQKKYFVEIAMLKIQRLPKYAFNVIAPLENQN
jgi:hypothetical protein